MNSKGLRLFDKSFFKNIFSKNIARNGAISKSGKNVQMKNSEILFFVQSVCEFLKVNNDLVFCLEASMHCIKGKKRANMKNIIERLKQGFAFSSAIEEYGIFPSYITKIIKASERNKSFQESFNMIKEFLEWHIEQKKKLQVAMIYPLFTFIVFVGITFLFSNYIIPSILELMNSMNPNNLGNYKIFFGIISFLKGVIFIATIALLSIFSTYYFKRDLFERMIISFPIIGKFVKYKSIYMSAYNISNSLQNGCAILESFNIAKDSSSILTKNILSKIQDDVKKGIKISESMKNFKIIPEIAVDIINTGENAGNLANSMKLMHHIFQSRYQEIMNKLINILPIALIVFTALLMIGFVVLIFMPIYNFGI